VVEVEPSVIKFQPSFMSDDDSLDCEQENQETTDAVHTAYDYCRSANS
jgi:hypothetical protein